MLLYVECIWFLKNSVTYYPCFKVDLAEAHIG